MTDACTRIEESDIPPHAVALVGSEDGFLLARWGNSEPWEEAAAAATTVCSSLERLATPVVAVVCSDAIGPAWEIALACDLRVAADDVEVGAPHVRLGYVPSAGATQRLPRIVGIGTALRLLLLGEIVPASEAAALGLFDVTAPREQLEAHTEKLLGVLRAAAPIALSYAKEAIRGGADLPLSAGLRLEADLAAILHTTDDRAEGIASFLERRAPEYRGR
jgi:enoyl-CoA hydratase/carnithine racemase